MIVRLNSLARTRRRMLRSSSRYSQCSDRECRSSMSSLSSSTCRHWPNQSQSVSSQSCQSLARTIQSNVLFSSGFSIELVVDEDRRGRRSQFEFHRWIRCRSSLVDEQRHLTGENSTDRHQDADGNSEESIATGRRLRRREKHRFRSKHVKVRIHFGERRRIDRCLSFSPAGGEEATPTECQFDNFELGLITKKRSLDLDEKSESETPPVTSIYSTSSPVPHYYPPTVQPSIPPNVLYAHHLPQGPPAGLYPIQQ